MSGLAKRTLYLAASALILVAIAAELVAKDHAGRGMMAMAQAASMPRERLRLIEAAQWHASRSGVWDLISLSAATIAVGAWVGSRKRREPGRQGVPLLLFCVYLLLLFLFV